MILSGGAKHVVKESQSVMDLSSELTSNLKVIGTNIKVPTNFEIALISIKIIRSHSYCLKAKIKYRKNIFEKSDGGIPL